MTGNKAYSDAKILNDVLSKYKHKRYKISTQMRMYAKDKLISWLDNLVLRQLCLSQMSLILIF
ncbi:hypothetical protein [Bacillus thuringiensis]|uniref:hypothetical protein n=1 Tax=Bacillus thuringiensis TaxID=1428 RepID=UPI0027DEE942|nr:hypothetical protein [Bacillus thuringiensis]